MENLLNEFSLFAEELQLPAPIFEKVKEYLQELSDSFLKNFKLSQKVLCACCIYIIIQDSDVKTEDNSISTITVSDLLDQAGMSIMDLFNVTGMLKTYHHLSDSATQKFIGLERKYLIVSALYDKFEGLVKEIFCAEYTAEGCSSISDASYELKELLQHQKALCWMLFIVAKAKILWHRQELLATFNLLLCCIAEVIKVTPTFLLLPPFDSVVGKNEDCLVVLKLLSSHVSTRFEEVIAVHDGWLHVANELIIDSKLPELNHLRNIYNHLYRLTGDIDESKFLIHYWQLLPTHNPEQSVSSHKRLIRRTLDTADALNKMLSTTSDEISQKLKIYLQKCTVDGELMIKDFIKESRETFIDAFVNAQEGSNKNLAERRFKLAVRYYYLMLETLLEKESERLQKNGGTHDLSSFLRNNVFQKSLLSCCLEVTLMSYGNIGSNNFTPVNHDSNTHAQGILFPWILNIFELEPFQFFKIIETFIRFAPTITQMIIKHLSVIENRILEQLAWQSGSSLFRGLLGVGCSSTCKAKSDSTKYWSPNKDASQISPRTPSFCSGVNLFLNKVCRLAYQRLEKLCALLQIEKDVQANIWTCIEHVLYKMNHLLENRHLDQIVMCCIFAISKVLEKDVKFKTIIAYYSQMSNTSVSVYKHVLSNGKKDYIIMFYNREFHSEMKDYILTSFGSKDKVTSSSSFFSSPFKLSPSFTYSLPGRKNIFISPLRQSPFKNPNEVISRQFPSYSLGSLTQSPKTLQTINDALNVLHPTTFKGNKRLQFRDEDAGSSKKNSNSRQECSSAKRALKFEKDSLENSESDKFDVDDV